VRKSLVLATVVITMMLGLVGPATAAGPCTLPAPLRPDWCES
jgi:hypothetical protein